MTILSIIWTTLRKKVRVEILIFFVQSTDKYLYFIPRELKLCAISRHSRELKKNDFLSHLVGNKDADMGDWPPDGV